MKVKGKFTLSIFSKDNNSTQEKVMWWIVGVVHSLEEEELNLMEQQGVISKVELPTAWCAWWWYPSAQEGILCKMDDLLIWGTTQREHDERLRKMIFNDKCKFLKSREVSRTSHSASVVSADPKVSTVKVTTEPSNVSEVRCFLEMANHLGKFLPYLAEKKQHLRDLLRQSHMWARGIQQCVGVGFQSHNIQSPIF